MLFEDKLNFWQRKDDLLRSIEIIALALHEEQIIDTS